MEIHSRIARVMCHSAGGSGRMADYSRDWGGGMRRWGQPGAFAVVGAPPKIFPHAFWAAWNAGELGLTPGPPILTPKPPPGAVWNWGSGKSGTPCERMQRDIASACALTFAVWAADGWP